MKNVLISLSLMLLCALSLRAQRVQVLDNDGLPVPFVAATTPDGKYIASTDANGWFDDLSGNKTIHLSQVAYKPLTIDVANIKGNKIVLDDATYDCPRLLSNPRSCCIARPISAQSISMMMVPTIFVVE